MGVEVELLKAINQKLSILDLLRKDIGEIRSDLEVTQSQIDQLRIDNRTLKGITKAQSTIGAGLVYPEEVLQCNVL